VISRRAENCRFARENLQVKKPLGVFAQDLFFDLLGQCRVIAQMFQVAGELAIQQLAQAVRQQSEPDCFKRSGVPVVPILKNKSRRDPR
jgi:hypothetical protein